MATAHSAVATGRDIRLDLFRGLALWFIFLDHIPTNIVSWLTGRNYGFSDALEIFVFISGYAAVIVYGRMMTQEGWPRTAAQIYRRVWQLYVAHILLFVACSAQVVWVSIARDTPALIEEMEMLGFGQNPYQAILEAVLLRFRPANLDVLPLYIVLLAAFPMILPAMMRWPLGVIALSMALYAVTSGTTGTYLPIPMGKCGTSIRWLGRSFSMSGQPAPHWELGLHGSIGFDGKLRPLPRRTFYFRLSSPCRGTTTRWNGWCRTGSRGRSTRLTRPISMSCDLCISSPSHGWSGC